MWPAKLFASLMDRRNVPTRAYRYEYISGPRVRAALSLVCVLLALGLAVGCGGGSQSGCTGAERCSCYPNNTCNAGLTCLSDVCVDSPTGAGGAAGATGAAGVTGAAA
jgi:hypothetical protein